MINNGEIDIVHKSTMDRTNSKVTYRVVLEIATDLCRTVSDDPKLCTSTYATIFEWITRLRQGDDFDVAFHNKAIHHTSNSSASSGKKNAKGISQVLKSEEVVINLKERSHLKMSMEVILLVI